MLLKIILPLFIVTLFSCSKKSLKVIPIPEKYHEVTTVLGNSNIKSWGDNPSRAYTEYVDTSYVNARTKRLAHWNGKDIVFLALSGGGSKGAYGAGILCGWTKSKQRPKFTIVTGISTGSLIAPFAFLGSSYDSILNRVFTTLSSDSLVKPRKKIKAFTSDAMSDNDGLKKIINRYVDKKMMQEIAKEYDKGRYLFIGTTDLDSQRPVIWSIGEIAKVGTNEALNLIRKVIVASTSIPMAFPPVKIDVEVDDQKFQEYHVDGGIGSQVFLFPSGTHWNRLTSDIKLNSNPKLYVICNDYLEPERKRVELKTLKLAGQAITSLIRNQMIGDLYRIYTTAKLDNFDFNFSSIPSGLEDTSKEPFDLNYMNRLFDFGFERGEKQVFWETEPPRLDNSKTLK